MTSESNPARVESDVLRAKDDAARSASGPFVINLCSSTTPMALRSPDAPELRRFTFFVSRRLEDGRERFRLHMGHFDTLADAEDWLGVVRDLYPGAWAGEAPGKKLRAAAAAAALDAKAAVAEPAAPVRPVPEQVPVQVQVPPPPAAAPRHDRIPVVQAARSMRPAPHSAPVHVARAPSTPGGVFQQSNVRQVLAALDAPGSAPRTVPSRPSPPAPAPAAPSPARRPAPARTAEAVEASLTDTQVLRMLEHRRDAAPKPKPLPTATSGAPEEIKLLRPYDASTMKELRRGLKSNEQVSFAVQLEWSVQAIDLKKVPPLAIFSAYTLYTVEGNREGRKWYGLRLGFFSDSLSAKQVALYVRSEFSSVAVVPVSGREKSRASEHGRLSPSALGQARHRSKPAEEFKLLDETQERPAVAPEPARAAAPAGAAGAQPAAKPAAGRTAGVRRPARPKTIEETLEETLEILGASQLTLQGDKDSTSASGVRHLKISYEGASDGNTGTFRKLLDRLSDRLVRGK